jgi:NAD(P)-dependent dehydrogenase (short-subunit alcohol dehydrogenase family)
MDGKAQALRGTTVAVTGANRGIGLGLCRALALARAQLVVHARTEEKARGVVEAALAQGARAVGVAGELRDADLGGRLAAAARDAFGGLDVLVLNAAVLGPRASLGETSASALLEVLAINVAAALELVQGTHGLLARARPGVVVWISSGLGRFGLAGYGAYCASKHALEGLMKVAAEEDRTEGIVHLAVAPGMVGTDMLREALGEADLSRYLSPDEVGRALARLVADARGGLELNGRSIDLAQWLG